MVKHGLAHIGGINNCCSTRTSMEPKISSWRLQDSRGARREIETIKTDEATKRERAKKDKKQLELERTVTFGPSRHK
jgi:hypothetical protein